MVGHLRRVEHALRLLQRLAADGLDELRVGSHSGKAGLVQAVQRLRALGVDVVREVQGVHTRVGGVLLLVEALDEVECHLSRVAELPVAVHLQRCQVVELRGLLLALFLLHLGHGEGLALDGAERLFALFLRGELSLELRSSLLTLGRLQTCLGLLSLTRNLGGRERRVAVDRGQYPVRLGLEVLNLLLAVDDEGESGGLHAADAEHLPVLPVFQRV